ncbi:MAG TPA: C/D box methylation guide ribonucleoprotein complex aNOP56 subunit [Euryarchaeota archaeon]|nr:C/D box methylation guide ribonucleoprotein complex aNOP56 subunit [Euryarchaeota archaeon]HIQ10231.1 C/D box methylation guide ribonucleoprotein complex aNOP56 subunit [Euryarchaeota archaeon]
MTRLAELRKKIVEKTKKKVEEVYTERDRYIIQAIEALDDLDAAYNLLVERLREWYGLHFPEVNQLVKDHEKFVALVADVGARSKMDADVLEQVLGEKLAHRVAEAAKDSMGTVLEGEDLKMIQDFAARVRELREMRERLADYIREQMKEIAPNTAAVAGPLLGARLLSKAGGLKKLAMLPASTIQVLGAEKALFKHLVKGTPPPKHGLLFQHPLVRNAKKWQRGKIARTIAAKLAIAAREDYFGGKNISDKLLAEIEERVREIKEKYPNPPKRSKSYRKCKRAKGKKKGKKR